MKIISRLLFVCCATTLLWSCGEKAPGKIKVKHYNRYPLQQQDTLTRYFPVIDSITQKEQVFDLNFTQANYAWPLYLPAPAKLHGPAHTGKVQTFDVMVMEKDSFLYDEQGRARVWLKMEGEKKHLFRYIYDRHQRISAIVHGIVSYNEWGYQTSADSTAIVYVSDPSKQIKTMVRYPFLGLNVENKEVKEKLEFEYPE